MKYALSCLLISLCLLSCRSNSNQNGVKTVDAEFDTYKEQFVEVLWKLYPGWASSQGYHKYDSLLVVPDSNARNKEKVFAKSHMDWLATFDKDKLSDNNKTDYLMMQDFLQSITWSIDTLRSFEWNPSQYNIAEGFAMMLNDNYDSLDNRLRNF